METLLITAHYIICFVLIMMILLQAGKGADIGAVFGGASQTMFGSRGPATFLNKITVGVAMGFLVTSIALAHVAKTRSGASVLDRAPMTETAPATSAEETTPAEAPATPAETPAAPEAPAKGAE